jgi:hypothetical protein
MSACLLCAAALAGAPFVRASRGEAQDDGASEFWVDGGDEGEPRDGLRVRGANPRSLGDARASGTGLTLGRGPRGEVPPSYVVRRRDTLWDITEHFYGNPYEWPRIWSYNPEITNPHWIYPDQVIRLQPEGGPAPIAARTGPPVVPRRSAESGTVFLREQGWLDEDALETAGVIIGSPDDHMMLSPFDQAYVRFDRLPAGQSEPRGEYTVYRELAAGDRAPGEEGTLVRILGTVRIDSWDPERRTARVTIIEALDPIERGHRVAAIPRRFEIVAPVRSEIDLETRVVAALMPIQLIGDQQIVFVGAGEQDGLRLGHRLFIVRAGDEWRQNLSPAQASAATVEPPEEPESYPDEVIAEGRVVALRPRSAGLMITRAVRAVRLGDRAQLRRGY